MSPVEMSALRRVLRAQEVPVKATRLVIDQQHGVGRPHPPAGSDCCLPPSGCKVQWRLGDCGLFFRDLDAAQRVGSL